MILYGASGHCKVIIDCLKSRDERISAIIDDDKTKISFYGLNVLHDYNNIDKSEKLIISIGNNVIRKDIAAKLSNEFGLAIHKNSIISDSVKIGEGTVIIHNSVIQADTYLGKHVIVNTSSSIDHNCIIENFVHISPNAALCGGVSIGEGTHIGAGTIVIPGIKIGRWCTIGAGTIVIIDVPDFAVVVGNPGRIIKYFNPFTEKNEK